jgi:hypothetical protein
MLDSKTYVVEFQIHHNWESYKTIKPSSKFLTIYEKHMFKTEYSACYG